MTAESVYRFNDLGNKDGNLEGFQNTWEMVLACMQRITEDEYLEYFHHEAIKAFKGLSDDISDYNRKIDAPYQGGPECINPGMRYKYLYSCVER